MGKDLDVCLLIDYYGKTLTQKQFDAIDLYYNEDLSLAEIAEHTGITRQGVRDAIKHAEETLFSLENNLGYVKKSKNVRKSLEELSGITQRLHRLNSTALFSQDIASILSDLQSVLNSLSEFSSEDDDGF